MFDYVSVLKQNPNGVLATKNGEKLDTRMFQFLFADGNKVYFCTGSEKPVYAQMKADPHVSFCTFPASYNPVVSVNGKAVFVEDMSLKTRALDENPTIKKLYQTPENPVFQLFYIDTEAVETFSFTEGSKNFTV